MPNFPLSLMLNVEFELITKNNETHILSLVEKKIKKNKISVTIITNSIHLVHINDI